MYKLWFPTFGYYKDDNFVSIEEAKTKGVSSGFEFWVVNDFDGIIEYRSGQLV
nr:MAG: hypothetical protein [Caudoviricetes sp.]